MTFYCLVSRYKYLITSLFFSCEYVTIDLKSRNFTRVTRGPETGSYHHPLFRRGERGLCSKMTCHKSGSFRHTEPMNPVALGIATPGMVQHGFIDSKNSLRSDSDKDDDKSTSFMDEIVAFLQPTPLHPSIDGKLSELRFSHSLSAPELQGGICQPNQIIFGGTANATVMSSFANKNFSSSEMRRENTPATQQSETYIQTLQEQRRTLQQQLSMQKQTSFPQSLWSSSRQILGNRESISLAPAMPANCLYNMVSPAERISTPQRSTTTNVFEKLEQNNNTNTNGEWANTVSSMGQFGTSGFPKQDVESLRNSYPATTMDDLLRSMYLRTQPKPYIAPNYFEQEYLKFLQEGNMKSL